MQEEIEEKTVRLAITGIEYLLLVLWLVSGFICAIEPTKDLIVLIVIYKANKPLMSL